MITSESQYYCSVTSEEHGEAIFATASHCKFFVLVADNHPLPASISKAEALKDKDWLLPLLKEVNARKGKLLLIRSDEPLIYFVDHFNNRYCTHNYSNGFNAGVLWDDENASWQNHPFFLVCTNGKKDKCCSLKGLPVFKALKKVDTFNAFQCSHVGGDRFAANVLLMPAGIYYGRIKMEDVPALISATKQNQILLKNLRGRSKYNFLHQAADYFLRKHFNDFSIEAETEWLAFHQHADHYEATAKFKGQKLRLKFQRIAANDQYKLTCSSSIAEPHYQYQLLQLIHVQ